MTTAWTAPLIDRIEPALVAAERASLEAWLDYHRQTLLWKCSGLTADQLKTRAAAPSALSLLGLVRHMAEVERWWFQIYACGADQVFPFGTDDDPDADFNAIAEADAKADLAVFAAEVTAARQAVAAVHLDTVIHSPQPGRPDRDLRWIYLHMIEEYARHNGHADLLRELIDGATGD